MEKISDILSKNNFSFKKQLGQNFITDTNLLKAIVQDAGIDKNSDVIEIGVGAGTLTTEIAEKANKVIGYEIDKSLADIHAETLKGYQNIEIIYQDIMKVPDSQINSHFNRFSIIANLPYYITTPIIFKFLEGDFNIDSITIMVQKEVADRIIAKKGTKDYGILTLMIGLVADAEITRVVNRKMFTPEPNVDSAVVKMTLKPTDINRKLFRNVVNVAFNKRRKTLANNLKTDMKISQQDIERIFNLLNLDLRIRGEALSLEDFKMLTKELEKISDKNK